MADELPGYEGWAIVEQLGHRRLAGYIRPVDMYGARLARLDIPAVDGQPARTQYLGGSSIYALHPCDETIATAAARRPAEPPVSRWEIRQALPAVASEHEAMAEHYGPDPDPDLGRELDDDEEDDPDVG